MDSSAILQAISTVGFPIVMCLLMMFYIRETAKTHSDETIKFTEALNKNTLVLQHLCDTIEKDND